MLIADPASPIITLTSLTGATLPVDWDHPENGDMFLPSGESNTSQFPPEAGGLLDTVS